MRSRKSVINLRSHSSRDDLSGATSTIFW
jgi:hypothetical protein